MGGRPVPPSLNLPLLELQVVLIHLQILVGILTGHADFNQHLFIMGVSQVSKCPLCQEDEDTSLHFIAQCSALMLVRKNILGDYTILLDTLSDIHWFLLLKFVKASKRFCRPWGLSGLRTGPMKWPRYYSLLASGLYKVFGWPLLWWPSPQVKVKKVKKGGRPVPPSLNLPLLEFQVVLIHIWREFLRTTAATGLLL